MQHLISILRAAHCRSTHHYFALDALDHLQTAQSRRLANILLKYHDDYLIGAKAPDSDFKDYQNHVLHVQQNNWGGAAVKCEEWLKKARDFLDQGQWKKASYACGVLSHYFTDPIMPLHTAQSELESVMHRPLEWSIYKSYDQILSHSRSNSIECEMTLCQEDAWIGKAVTTTATYANRHYHRLMEAYQPAMNNSSTRTGSSHTSLPQECVEILAELFMLAIHGFATILTRLADETTKPLPQVNLTLTALLARIDMPLAWIVRRISDAGERRKVESLLREYSRTGEVKRHVPAEVLVVRKAIHDQPDLRLQVDKTRDDTARDDTARGETARGETARGETARDDKVLSEDAHSDKTHAEKAHAFNVYADNVNAEDHGQVAVEGESEILPTATVQIQAVDAVYAVEPNQIDQPQPRFIPLSQARSLQQPHHQATPTGDSEITKSSDEQDDVSSDASSDVKVADSGETISDLDPQDSETDQVRTIAFPTPRMPHLPHLPHASSDLEETTSLKRVHFGSPLVDAPSIGPKTAKRFEKIGVYTIRQLVNQSAESIVQQLGTRWITEQLVQDWQDQARLVCEVPVLTGYRAQLLVGVGCRTSWQLRTANANALHGLLVSFCRSAEGQRILRSSKEPTVEHIATWIASAREFARREVA